MRHGRRRLLLLLLFLAALFSSGCYSVQEHRARQFKSAWEQLNPTTQERLRELTIAVGDAPKAVYFALGTPNYAYRVGFDETVWVYWGVVGEEHLEASPARLSFASRGELRFPRPGEERVELRIHFDALTLREWKLGPIDLPAAANYRPLPMGSFPALP